MGLPEGAVDSCPVTKQAEREAILRESRSGRKLLNRQRTMAFTFKEKVKARS